MKNIALAVSVHRSLLFLLLAGGLLLLFSQRACSTGKGRSNPPTVLPQPKPSGGGTGIGALTLSQAPRHVRKMIHHLKSVRHFRPPKGYKGGRLFRNREGRLPHHTTYYEYDLHPLRPNLSRGPERLVMDQQKSVFYYTKDHYTTFIQILLP